MPLLFLLLALFLALPASAAPFRYLYETPTQAGGCRNPCTGTVCARTMSYSTAATEGLSTEGLYAIRVTVCAQPGFTLAGTGVLGVWLYSADFPGGGGWSYASEAGMYPDNRCNGKRCCTFLDREAKVRLPQRIAFAAEAIEVTGGSCLTVMTDAVLETEVKR